MTHRSNKKSKGCGILAKLKHYTICQSSFRITYFGVIFLYLEPYTVT